MGLSVQAIVLRFRSCFFAGDSLGANGSCGILSRPLGGSGRFESAPESRIQFRSNKRSLHRFRYRRPGAKQRHRKSLQYAAQMYTLRAPCGSFRGKQEAVRYVLDEFGHRKQGSTTEGQTQALALLYRACHFRRERQARLL